MAIEISGISASLEKNIECIKVQQYDTGRILRFTLTDDIQGVVESIDLTNNTIVLVIKKPGGDVVVIDGSVIDGNSGQCQVQLTGQATAEVGECKAQLLMMDSDTVRSAVFTIDVKESLDSDSAIESTSEYTALQVALQQVNEAINEVSNLTYYVDQVNSAYQIYLDNGGTGSFDEWLASFEGQKGEQGEQGPAGPAGQAGPQGEQGIQGEKGDPPAIVTLANRAAYDALQNKDSGTIYVWGA